MTEVDVEQIMRDIRSRISQRHGIELTTQQIEELAAQLCSLSGGDWSRKYTKRNRWRKRNVCLHL